MRTLGLLSPFRGTAHNYYLRALDDAVCQRSGHAPGARVIALGFNPSLQLEAEEKWWTLVQRIRVHVSELAAGGAEAVMLAPLAWYRFVDEIAESSPVPLLHPVDALKRELDRRAARFGPLGLIAPVEVANPQGLLARLSRETGREVILPDEAEAHGLAELFSDTLGDLLPKAETVVRRIMARFREAGAAAIVVDSPELVTAMKPADFTLDCYNLPALCVAHAAEWMLSPS